MKKHYYNFYKNIVNSNCRSFKIKSGIRWIIRSENVYLAKKNTGVRIKNRCIITNRSRGVYKFINASRLFLRDSNYVGHVLGLRKSYW